MLGEFAMSYPPQRSAFDMWYPAIIDRQDNDLLVAELQGEVTGYVMATTTPTLFANGPITELLELFVKPAHRNLGMGRRQVQAVLVNAKYAGARGGGANAARRRFLPEAGISANGGVPETSTGRRSLRGLEGGGEWNCH